MTLQSYNTNFRVTKRKLFRYHIPIASLYYILIHDHVKILSKDLKKEIFLVPKAVLHQKNQF